MAPTAKRLLIVWHSRTGGAEQMAAAAAAGAGLEAEIAVDLRRAVDAQAADVLAAAGYLFVAPENLGSMTGPMKDFFERIYYPALDQLNGRPYAMAICAGTDGTGAARQIERIATGLRLKMVAPTLIVHTGAQTPAAIEAPKMMTADALERCRALGQALAAGLAAGIF